MSYELPIPPYDRRQVRLPGGVWREYVAEPTPRAASYVYCMLTRVAEQPYLKIGISKSPLHRLQQISYGRGAAMPPGWQQDPIDLVATQPGGRAEERRIHHDLGKYRVRGTEWFLGRVAVGEYLNEDPAWRMWWPLELPAEADEY